MPAHTLRDGNLRQMARAVGPLANGLWKMEVRGRPQLYSFRPIAPCSSANKGRLNSCKIPRYGYLGKIKNCFTTMAHQSSKIGNLPTRYIVTGRIRGGYGNYLPSQGQGIHPWIRCESLRVQAPGDGTITSFRLVASVMSVMSVIFYCWYFDVFLTRRHRLTTTDPLTPLISYVRTPSANFLR